MTADEIAELRRRAKTDAYMTQRYAQKWIVALDRVGCTCREPIPFVIDTSEPNGRGEFMAVRFQHKDGCPASGTIITAADIGEAA